MPISNNAVAVATRTGLDAAARAVREARAAVEGLPLWENADTYIATRAVTAYRETYTQTLLRVGGMV